LWLTNGVEFYLDDLLPSHRPRLSRAAGNELYALGRDLCHVTVIAKEAADLPISSEVEDSIRIRGRTREKDDM
jgi:hypothetical protein